MKPLYLAMRNIGPFRSQDINFEELGDMFLICGKTGAGKSTVFDAITYALYGRLPGARSNVSIRQLKSDFCSEDDEASVTFRCRIKNTVLTIIRTLPRTYINRNGKKSEKPEELSITREEQGKEIPLSGNQNELKKQLEAYIGLTAAEFSRIVLLPQGEFADFLRQNSTERAATLAKLFPVQEYEEITEQIKQESLRLNASLQTVQQQLESYGTGYNPEQEAETVRQMELQLKQAENQKQELRQAQLKLENRKLDVQHRLEQFAEEAQLRQQLARYEAEREYQEHNQYLLEQSVAAEPAAAAADEADRYANGYREVLQALSGIRQEMDNAGQILSDLKQQEPRIQEAEAAVQAAAGLIPEINRAVEAEQEAEVLSEKIKEQEKRAALYRKERENLESEIAETLRFLEKTETAAFQTDLNQLSEEIRNLSVQLEQTETVLKQAEEKTVLIARISQQEKELEELKTAADTLQEQLMHRQQKLQHQAYLEAARTLSASLRDGEPCPVCGSTRHPVPAHVQSIQPELFPSGSISGEPKTAEAKDTTEIEQQYRQAADLAAQAAGRLTQMKETLDSKSELPDVETARQQVKIIQVTLEQKQRNQTEAKQLQQQLEISRNKYRNLQQQLGPVQKQETECSITLETETGKLHQLEETVRDMLERAAQQGFTGTSAAVVAAQATQQTAIQQKKIEDYRRQVQDAEKILEKNRGSLEQLQQEEKRRYQEADAATQRLKETLERTGFMTPQEAKAARLSQEQTENLKNSVETWISGSRKTETLLANLRQELNGTREEADEELIQITAAAENTGKLYDQLETETASLLVQRENRAAGLAAWKKLESDRLNLSRQECLYRQLYQDIAGKKNKKIALTTWILGVYLDQITAYAGSRLHRISDGRYTLLMTQEQTGGGGAKGLELEILDAYTGKKRPCNTLSGGETFMASISLALALTDVVSNRAGGITLDSLFIDEGFGSLDDTALEMALSILDEIRGNRCIGLISHVPELKNRIPVRLEINKTSTGSTAAIVHCSGCEE